MGCAKAPFTGSVILKQILGKGFGSTYFLALKTVDSFCI